MLVWKNLQLRPCGPTAKKIFTALAPYSFYNLDHYIFALPCWWCLGVDTPTTKFLCNNDRFEASLGQLNICIRRFLRRLPGPHALIKPRPLLVLFSQHHGRPTISRWLDHDDGEEVLQWSGGSCEFFWRWLIFGRWDSLPTGRTIEESLQGKL